MRKGKFLLVFTVLALMVSLGPGVVVAQKPPSEGPVSEGHFLIRPDDVAAFGNVQIAEPEGSVESREAIDRRPLAGWEEGYSTVLLVTSPQSDEFVALIYSASYKFTSPQVGETALDTLPEPIEDYSWEMVVKDDVSVFDDDLVGSLAGRSWHLWRGIDNEGMPAYFLWIQSGPYVAEVYLNVLQESVGHQLLNHIARRVIQRAGGAASAETPTRPLPAWSPRARPGPEWWFSGARADHFEFPCCVHVLAVWTFPYGHDPHFHGAGGDATTCSSNHGCISNWTWWLQVLPLIHL